MDFRIIKNLKALESALQDQTDKERMNTENIAGGPGKCPKCGQYRSNVSLHQNFCGVEIPAPLKSSFPVTIYFGTREEADGFIALVREANPNLSLANK